MTGCAFRRYEQLETFPETIEQELRPAVCERRQTDRFKENYNITRQVTRATHARNRVCPRVELILKIIIILPIIFLGFIKSKQTIKMKKNIVPCTGFEP